MKKTLCFFLFFLAVILAGCHHSDGDSDDGSTVGPSSISLKIEPAEQTILVNSDYSFTATATLSDGNTLE